MIQLQNVTKRIKENTKLDIMAYTGFTFEQLVEKSKTDEVLFMVYMGKMVQERLCC